MDSYKPSLIETSTKYYLKRALIHSRVLKDKYITIFTNISLFLLLIGGVSLFLWYRYKGKLTPVEKAVKDKEKKEYLMKKMREFAIEKQKNQQSIITNLPIEHPQTLPSG